MDVPICLSRNFVNRQNVRSFGNILEHRVLKSEDDNFINRLFGANPNIIEEIPPDVKYLLAELKQNLRLKSKHDFRDYFQCKDVPNKKISHLQSVSKDFVFTSSWKAVCEIVPSKLITDKNIKVFRQLVQSAIYSMRHQHFLVRKFIDKWDFSMFLQTMDLAKNILYHILIWILKYILSPMISLNFHVTTCKIDADEYKLHYFWKRQWQSFYDNKISEMIFARVIRKCEPCCLGKKIKRKHGYSEQLIIKSLKKNIPKLHLILKPNNKYRPIVQYKTNPQNTSEKYKIKERLNFLKILIGKPQIKLETLFNKLHAEWLKSNKPKLYFIKTDLTNAFGAVNREKLLTILYEKHLAIQKEENNITLKKKYVQQFKDMNTELRKPLLVRAGSTILKWQEGLVQGYKYSPALSELYYRHMDETYFLEHFKKSVATLKLFTRVVDDYLYITDSLADANSFLSSLTNYKNVNYGKTEVNFYNPDIKFNNEITFLGYSYNTEKMVVSRATNAFVGQMCYKIAFAGDITNVNKFLENRISKSGIPISGHIFNLLYNPEELIWKHIFVTFCISANKFCTILAVLCEEKDMFNYLAIYKKKVAVNLSNTIVEVLMKNKPSDIEFVFCINHFRYLSWKALYLCAKGTPKCNAMIPRINDELAKTNCLFGKWRAHASSINTSGEIIKTASREICRRTDLRIIVKYLDMLPTGFECYNHRKINKS